MGPPSVFANLGGLAGAYSFEQNIAQPRCVASVKAESLPEYPGLVPTAWVRWVQAIVLDFADIEDRLIALRQTRHDRTLASHAVWCKHVSSSDPEKGGEHLDAQSRFWLDNQSATAKQKFPSSSAVARLRPFHMRAALPLHSPDPQPPGYVVRPCKGPGQKTEHTPGQFSRASRRRGGKQTPRSGVSTVRLALPDLPHYPVHIGVAQTSVNFSSSRR